MAGGLEAALAAGATDVAALVPGGGVAVDLGAGFGMHSIPLARAGYDVVAIDTSKHLLEVLRAESGGLPIRAIEADLLDFRRHVTTPASLVVCLGDTLTHLTEPADVSRLIQDVAASLAPGGRVLLTFRDYTRPRAIEDRFFTVRGDADRVHHCFLDEQDERMIVHDIVHERDGAEWRMRVSTYPKLRLAPQSVAEMLSQAGLTVALAPGPRGMTAITATRA
jgi:SAM-dependent methyltransferase